MKNVFGDYSKYYDIIYKTKNYEQECSYIENILTYFGNSNKTTLLDLGCGTGGHSLIWAKRGWKVYGIDRSQAMLDIALQKAAKENVDIQFAQGDLSSFTLSGKFDIAVSMFAVVSYLTDNNYLKHFFKTVSQSLTIGGYLIFDAWFGPGVLNDKPGDRFRIIDMGEDRIIRFTHSEMYPMNNTVDVNFKIMEIKGSQILAEVDERHTMRYYFVPEIKLLLEAAGLELAGVFPFMKIGEDASDKDWNVTFVTRKKNEP